MKNKFITLLLIFNILATNCFAQGIFDESNTITVAEDGLIYSTAEKTFSVTGQWIADGLGFMEYEKKISQEAGASVIWDGIRPGDNGFYDIYIWKSVVENGDKNVMISWFATGSSSGNSFMDCSQGYSGWEYVGTTNTSDLVFDLSVTASGEGVAAVSCFRLVRTTKDAFLNYLSNAGNQTLILKIGSGTALLNDRQVKMNMGEAVINHSRTMVPLRFIMEIMGADVNWDSQTRSIYITSGEKNIVFTVGSNEYSVNSEIKTLDSAPYISNNRTMIPLRVFSEALEKKVYWDERGVVIISGAELSDYQSAVEKGLGL